MTEADWRSYFLEAKAANTSDTTAVEASMKSLKMDISIKDAKSRVMKLTSEHQSKLEALDMEFFPFEEQKLSIRFLVAALLPTTLKFAVKKELKKK